MREKLLHGCMEICWLARTRISREPRHPTLRWQREATDSGTTALLAHVGEWANIYYSAVILPHLPLTPPSPRMCHTTRRLARMFAP